MSRNAIIQSSSYSGKIVLITGAARGIGKNIAIRFAGKKETVIIADLNEQLGKKTVSELTAEKLRAHFIRCNLSLQGEPEKLIKSVVKKFGRIDILVNNARSKSQSPVFGETEKSWNTVIGVTLKAAYFCSQAAVSEMKKTGGGVIINISSVEAILAGKDSPVYQISKTAILSMTRYFALHAGEFNIRVNAVLPGFIVQDEHQKSFNADKNSQYRKIAIFAHPLKRVGTSDDIAAAVEFLSSAHAGFITGQTLIVDGGLTIQEPSNLVYRFNKTSE